MRNSPLKFLALIFASLPFLCVGQEIHVMEKYILNEESDVPLLRYYLEEAYLPFLQRNGARQLIALKSIEQGPDEEIVVVYTLASMGKFQRVQRAQTTDHLYLSLAEPFLDPPDKALPFQRMERTLFESHAVPSQILIDSGEDTVFEFLAYGSPSHGQLQEYLAEFLKGDLREAYKSSGVNFVFSGVQLTGVDLPGMGFLLQFDNPESRKEMWKLFLSSDAWQKLERDPEFQDNLDRSTSTLYKVF